MVSSAGRLNITCITLWSGGCQYKGEGRVLRGGGWFNLGQGVRSAARDADAPGLRGGVGFRLARGQVFSEPAVGETRAGGAGQTERSVVGQA